MSLVIYQRANILTINYHTEQTEQHLINYRLQSDAGLLSMRLSINNALLNFNFTYQRYLS